MATMDNVTLWHEWPGNFSGGQSVDGIGSFMQYGNSVLGGNFGAIILFLVFAVSFIIQGGNSEKRGVTSLFITAMIATILMRVNMISFAIVIILWIVTGVGIILVRNSTNAGRL